MYVTNRVNISKMEPTDISEPNITGGYLLQIGGSSGWFGRQGRGNTQINSFKTTKGITGSIEYPKKDEITPEQKTYISEKLNEFEDEIYNGSLDSIDL